MIHRTCVSAYAEIRCTCMMPTDALSPAADRTDEHLLTSFFAVSQASPPTACGNPAPKAEAEIPVLAASQHHHCTSASPAFITTQAASESGRGISPPTSHLQNRGMWG